MKFQKVGRDVFVNAFGVQYHAILREGKYRFILKSSPMAYACTDVYIMYVSLFYVCVGTVCL